MLQVVVSYGYGDVAIEHTNQHSSSGNYEERSASCDVNQHGSANSNDKVKDL